MFVLIENDLVMFMGENLYHIFPEVCNRMFAERICLKNLVESLVNYGRL